MSIIRRGHRWYIKYRDAAGVWRRQVCTARTKAEAQVLEAEVRRQVDRQLRGLEPQPMETGQTFWGICLWWLEHRAPAGSMARSGAPPKKGQRIGRVESALRVHVERSPLGGLPMRAVSATALEDYFVSLERRGYKPRSINNLRRLLGGVINTARRAHMWAGENPVKGTRFRAFSPAPRPTLTPEEVQHLLPYVREDWRGVFATAAYLGLRKGELLGLWKSDYDRVRRTLFVGRSYQATQTKGKRIDHLPVPSILAPYLDRALASPGPYMFPGPHGARTDNAATVHVLHAALRRAGFIEGYDHKCRRCVRGKVGKERGAARRAATVRASDDEPRRCRACGFMLTPVPVARSLRFHDLRHSCATNLLKAGVPVQHVQRILRHSNIQTTVGTYGHLMTEDLRSAVEKFGPPVVQGSAIRAVK